MKPNRLEALFALLEETPNDPFLFYGIALEYLKTDENKAISYFEKLLTDFPDYVPTYYHAAQLYSELGRRPQAQQTYEKGLQVSSAQAEHHAYKELRSAYTNFMLEEEDEE